MGCFPSTKEQAHPGTAPESHPLGRALRVRSAAGWLERTRRARPSELAVHAGRLRRGSVNMRPDWNATASSTCGIGFGIPEGYRRVARGVASFARRPTRPARERFTATSRPDRSFTKQAVSGTGSNNAVNPAVFDDSEGIGVDDGGSPAVPFFADPKRLCAKTGGRAMAAWNASCGTIELTRL